MEFLIRKPLNIHAYSDADFGGDKVKRRSTTGFLLFVGKTSISWCSKLQHGVVTSTCKTQYYSI